MRVFLNGKFDLLTPAHYNLLNYARMYAGIEGQIMVAIDTDARIAESDPMLPVFHMEQRIRHLKMLTWRNGPMVDQVAVFEDDQGLRDCIQAFKPQYMVKGADWKGKPVIGEDLVPEIIWYPLITDEHFLKVSSSDFIKTILNHYTDDKRGI